MIKSLQSLRFVFIMLVVMSHIIGKSFDFGGECGVSFFFLLSGFVLSYAYGGQVSAGTFQQRRFLQKQLSKFYPLHVVTFFVMMMLDARLGRFFGWEQLVANLLLLQSWVPSDNFYFVANGLSWFLSDLLFFYVAFPFAFRLLTGQPLRRLLVGAAVVLALYAGLAVSIPEGFINPLLYAAPWTRLLDFSIGILLYRLYASEAGQSFGSWLSRQPASAVTLMEFALVLAVVASFFVYEHSSLRFRCTALFWFVLPAVLYFFVASDKLAGGSNMSVAPPADAVAWRHQLGDLSDALGLYAHLLRRADFVRRWRRGENASPCAFGDRVPDNRCGIFDQALLCRSCLRCFS